MKRIYLKVLNFINRNFEYVIFLLKKKNNQHLSLNEKVGIGGSKKVISEWIGVKGRGYIEL